MSFCLHLIKQTLCDEVYYYDLAVRKLMWKKRNEMKSRLFIYL
jgi:hypothetical protein